MVLLALSLLSVEGGGNCSREEGLFQERKAMKRKLGTLEVNRKGKQPILPHLHSLTLGVSVFFGFSFP